MRNEVDRLADHLVASQTRSDERNSLWRYFGLTKRGEPAKSDSPLEEKLDLILSELTIRKPKLRRRVADEYLVRHGEDVQAGVVHRQVRNRESMGRNIEMAVIRKRLTTKTIDDLVTEVKDRAKRLGGIALFVPEESKFVVASAAIPDKSTSKDITRVCQEHGFSVVFTTEHDDPTLRLT